MSQHFPWRPQVPVAAWVYLFKIWNQIIVTSIHIQMKYHIDLYSPSTIRLEMASVVPNSFLSLIFISPLSFLWHLIKWRLLSVSDVFIFTLMAGISLASSLCHCIFMGAPPENATFHLAFSPALTTTDSENLTSASESIFGGSTNLKTQQKPSKLHNE